MSDTENTSLLKRIAELEEENKTIRRHWNHQCRIVSGYVTPRIGREFKSHPVDAAAILDFEIVKRDEKIGEFERKLGEAKAEIEKYRSLFLAQRKEFDSCLELLHHEQSVQSVLEDEVEDLKAEIELLKAEQERLMTVMLTDFMIRRTIGEWYSMLSDGRKP